MSEADRILGLTPQDVLGAAAVTPPAAPLITEARLRVFAPRCDAAALAPALQAAAQRYRIEGVERAANWLGQLHVESLGLTRLSENLSYSAQRICEVWPSRFPNVSAAAPFVRNPPALACAVYGGRMGNDGEGDGWAFRGRGLIQLTGRDNYLAYGRLLGLDLVAFPDLAAEPVNAALIAAAFWDQRGLNALADRRDIGGITRAINGGLTGLDERTVQVARARAALGG